ncbi:hypothetical protein LX16_1833 [Stackebrandtia albiflava]|uniref:Uncharacterized protein n=1 Tax=Stackebrandtia albiflava TaxID=406432 RepID=A0A562VDZ9_9ACTN|nr:hypothetical protein [Stackebrandtia albiflava]TWJ16109.1 hypothetical protein LX16_1833 [Stackebrandtia albiflava]
MVDPDDLDGALAACPACDGLGIRLSRCSGCAPVPDGGCGDCGGTGYSQAMCDTCDHTGMVCAQLVISVINVDLATVASTQVVAGAHQPRRLPHGGWGIDCAAIVADLASQVSAPGLSPADSITEVIPLPSDYHPELPAAVRWEMEANAIAVAAGESRWRVLRGASLATQVAAHTMERPGCDCAGSAPPTGPAPHDTLCAHCRDQSGGAPAMTIPSGRRPAVGPARHGTGRWTVGHLTQLGFGLGLAIDVTCRAVSPTSAEVKTLWSVTWTAPDAPPDTEAEPLPEFEQAVAAAADRLAHIPGRLYPAGEMIPVPRQALPPVVGLARMEPTLSALTSYLSSSVDTTVRCRVEPGRCTIHLCADGRRRQLADGTDFESAMAAIGL